MSDFLQAYLDKITSNIDNNIEDNYDETRFGPSNANTTGIGLKQFCRSTLSAFGLVTKGAAEQMACSERDIFKIAIAIVFSNYDKLSFLYDHLCDAESRSTLINVMAYRSLGYRKIKLPNNCPIHWNNLSDANKLAEGGDSIESGFNGWKLTKMRLHSLGYPIEMYFTPTGVVIDFIEQQYRCDTPNGPIECSEDDYVIDAGGCWGDTALYFAHKTGKDGKVYSFEFLPENLKIYDKNLSLNPVLAPRIKRIENPIWSCSGEEVAISANGPGSSIISMPGYSAANVLRFQSVAIDELVRIGLIEKINFIKMDIEGAELHALKGAEQAIRRFKPKLAITIYHKLEDFWTIPQFLNSLDIGYKLYLRHFTIHSEETVLFAIAN